EIYGIEGDVKRETLESLIKELNLENNVFLMGYTNNIKDIYNQVGFKIVTSAFEGQPLAILESLSYGCPVVSYDCNYGPSDMIKNGENGYLVEFNNIEAMGNKIIELLQNPKEIKKLSKNSTKYLDDYTDEKFIDRWKDLFEKLKTKRLEEQKIIDIKWLIEGTSNVEGHLNKYRISIKGELAKGSIIDILDYNLYLRLKDRNKQTTIDIPINNKEIIDNSINIIEDIDISEIVESKYLDLYLLIENKILCKELRLGNKNISVLPDCSNQNVHESETMKLYYTKYGNLSFKKI
ncbi:MAG: glycosyltransferase, partial [Peptostreptococcaceae bacterium]